MLSLADSNNSMQTVYPLNFSELQPGKSFGDIQSISSIYFSYDWSFHYILPSRLHKYHHFNRMSHNTSIISIENRQKLVVPGSRLQALRDSNFYRVLQFLELLSFFWHFYECSNRKPRSSMKISWRQKPDVILHQWISCEKPRTPTQSFNSLNRRFLSKFSSRTAMTRGRILIYCINLAFSFLLFLIFTFKMQAYFLFFHFFLHNIFSYFHNPYSPFLSLII